MACVHLFKATAARIEEGRAFYLGHVGVNTEYPHLLSSDLSEEEFSSGVVGAAEHTEVMGKAQRERHKTGNVKVLSL